MANALAVLDIIKNALPVGIKFTQWIYNNIEKLYKEKKEAQKSKEELLYAIYNELRKNLAFTGSRKPGSLNTFAPNSPEVKTAASKLKITFLTKIHKIAAPFGKSNKLPSMFNEIFNDIDKAIRLTNDFRGITKMTDTELATRQKPNMDLKLKNIAKSYLAVYSKLFKTEKDNNTKKQTIKKFTQK